MFQNTVLARYHFSVKIIIFFANIFGLLYQNDFDTSDESKLNQLDRILKIVNKLEHYPEIIERL